MSDVKEENYPRCARDGIRRDVIKARVDGKYEYLCKRCQKEVLRAEVLICKFCGIFVKTEEHTDGKFRGHQPGCPRETQEGTNQDVHEKLKRDLLNLENADLDYVEWTSVETEEAMMENQYIETMELRRDNISYVAKMTGKDPKDLGLILDEAAKRGKYRAIIPVSSNLFTREEK